MGANAQTSVPAFTAGQILTAQQQTEINTGIPVFATTTTRDAAFGGTGEKVLAEGQMAYIEASDITQVYNGTSWIPAGRVLQIVTATNTTEFSSTSSSDVYTNFQATITPLSSASTIICIANISTTGTAGGGRMIVKIVYNTTSGGTTGTSLAQYQTGPEQAIDNRWMRYHSGTASVALASTSTHYFKVLASHADRDGAATWYMNQFSNNSSITLVEYV